MITIEMRGRLGNQMFEYATCRSIAEKNGYNYHILNFVGKQIMRFNLPMGQIDNNNTIHQYSCNDFTPYIQKNNVAPKEYWEMLDNTNLTGYYQHAEFF